jgi:transposase
MDTKDMTVKQIQEIYGVSDRQARRYKERGRIPTARKPKNPAPEKTEPGLADALEKLADSDEYKSAVFTVEEAPPNIFPEEKPLDKVFKALGLNAKKTEEKKDRVYDPKLSKAQQSIFDSFSPLAVALFIFCAGFVWTKIDPEIGPVLAPDKDVSEKIVHPLVRIYARHSKIAAALDPDTVDFSAAMAALVGYAWTSLSMYQQIKKEKELGYETQQENRTDNNRQSTDTNGNGVSSPLQNGHDSTNHRRYVTRTNSSVDGSDNGSVGFAANFDPGNLKPDERYQYERLSKLRALDTASRARRSGRG